MTESSGFLSAVADENTYSQVEWLAHLRDIRGNGIVYGGTYNTFAVTAQAAPNMTVKVDTGECWIQGNHYLSTATQNVTISTADATYARIDLIVLRNYINGSRKIDAIVIAGTPAAVPVAPSYSRTNDTWDLVLAHVAVAAAATTIVTGNITDKRTDATLCGESQQTYLRASDMITGSPWDVNGKRLTNLGTCTADNDAATYDYIETTTIPAGYICAFAGLSVPTDWLECNGTVYSSATYPDLYAQIGTTTLPDLRGRTPMGYKSTDTDFDTIGEKAGEDKHQLITGMPNHGHTGMPYFVPGKTETSANVAMRGAAGSGTGNTGGNASHENRPPYMVMKWMIKAVTN